MSSDAHTAGLEQDVALADALRLLLADARPPWWRLDLRWKLSSRKEWACTCAYYHWPQWFWEAVNCGADPKQLTAIHMLIFGYPPRKTKPNPYLGM